MSYSNVARQTPDILNPEMIADLSHVEGSCYLRTLTNSRWFRCTHTVIIRLVMIAALTVYKDLTCLQQCGFYSCEENVTKTLAPFPNMRCYFQYFTSVNERIMLHRCCCFWEQSSKRSLWKALRRKKNHSAARWFKEETVFQWGLCSFKSFAPR